MASSTKKIRRNLLCGTVDGGNVLIRVSGKDNLEATKNAHMNYGITYVEAHLTDQEANQYRAKLR